MMFLSKTKKFILPLLLLGSLVITGCGNKNTSNPTTSTSEVTPTLTLQDLFIKVGDVVPLDPVFTPTSAATSVTYTVEDETIVRVRQNAYLEALKVGKTSVTATSQNNLTDTFEVTVSEADEPELTLIEEFNKYGAFEDETLPGWSLSGTTASKHGIDIDNDRDPDDFAFKLWTGDFSDSDETASLIDVTLRSTFNKKFTAGDYTLKFDLVGVVNVIEVTLEGTTYTRANKEVAIGGANYRTNYIEFTLSEEKVITLAIKFYSPGTQTNWGFLDDVMLEEGHTKPVIVEPEDGNLLKDGSFEVAGSEVTYLSEESNEFLDWQFDGDLRNEESVTLNSWAQDRDWSLKYNYWPNNPDPNLEFGDLKVYQFFEVEEAGLYNLSYFIMGGGITNAKFQIFVAGEEVFTTNLTNADPYAKRTVNDINLPQGEAEFRIVFQEKVNTWIHLDYILLTKK